MGPEDTTPAEGIRARCLRTEQAVRDLANEVLDMGVRVTRIELSQPVPHWWLAVYWLASIMLAYYAGYQR